MKYYIKSIKLDENRPEVFYNLGNAFCIKENFKDAIRCYKKSIKLDPNNFETQFNLGNSYFVIGWYKEALDCYATSRSLGYDNSDLKFALARAHIELAGEDNLKEAEKHLFELLKNDPNNFKYLFYYARLKESSNKNEARHVYKRILESPLYDEKELPQVKDHYFRVLEELNPDNV
jgi:cytochrome c-type biogenesis protein CcmH/NrfG